MNLATVRDELVEQLATVSGLTVSDRPPTVLQPPHAYINTIPRVEPSQTFDGLYVVEFEVIVLVAVMDDEAGWDLLSTFVTDIHSALDSNDSLDSTVQFTNGGRFENVGDLYEYGPNTYRGMTARIEATAL